MRYFPRTHFITFALLASATASADSKELVKIAPNAGFIDDAIGGDDAHLVYAVGDGATKSELHVVRVDDPKQDVAVDISAITVHPRAVTLHGDSVFVVGEVDAGNVIGALVALPKGKVVYKVGPATDITALPEGVAVHRATASKDGTRHQVDLYALATGRRIASGRPLELDAAQTAKPLDFKVNHWAAGMTRAIGIKGGEWNKKDDQRSPDVEATYDLVTGKFVEQAPIENLVEQRKRFQALAEAHADLDYVHMTWDNAAVQIWRHGKPGTATLDQALAQYDPKSLQGVVAPDGTGWLALQVDPVNAEAVARKKADPEYFDIFHFTADGKATRRTRVPAKKLHFRFGVLGQRLWVLEKSPSSDRGGRLLTVLQLD